MSIWRKSAQKESRELGVARAALDGAPRDELIREALQALTRHGSKDRANSDTPQEWAHLSVDPPLPDESLLHGKTVEQDLESSPGNPILGFLAGLRYALWVPSNGKGN